MQEIEIPGVGVVEFPDSMSDEQIASAIKKHMQPSAPKESKLRGALTSIAQGATFGFADELSSAMAAIPAAMTTDASLSEAYKDILGAERARQAQYQRENPATSLGLEVAGGLMTGGAGGARALNTQAMKSLPKVAQYGLLGAGTGGLAGAGYGDEDRLSGALKGAAVGGITGSVAQPIAQGIKAAATPLVRPLLNRPGSQAKRMLSQAIQRDEMSPRRVLAGVRGLGAKGTIADAGGENVLGLARAATAVPGPAKNSAALALRERGAGQRNRILDAVKAGIGSKGDDLYTVADQLDDQMRTQAAPLYQAAREQGIELTDDLQTILKRIPKNVYSKAMEMARLEGDDAISGAFALSDDGATAIKVPDMRSWDYIKRGLDDVIESARRSGEKNTARVFTKLKRDLLSQLDDINPTYAEARKAYAGPAANREALDLGRKALRQDAEITERMIRGMSESEKEMYRIGVARSLADRMKTGKSGSSVLGKLDSPIVLERIKPAFPDDESFRSFVNLIKREARFSYTKDKVLGGSPTTRIAEEVQDASRPVGVATDIARGDYFGAIANMLRSARNPQTLPDPVKEELSRILFAQGFKPNRAIIDALERGIAPSIPGGRYLPPGLLGAFAEQEAGLLAR